MWTALLFGTVASSALLIGAAIGVRYQLPKRLLAILLSFAAGALVTALSFELFEDSYERGGIWRAGIGLLVGAIVFTVLSAMLDRWAQPRARSRPTSAGQREARPPMPLRPTHPRVASLARNRRAGAPGGCHPRRRSRDSPSASR